MKIAIAGSTGLIGEILVDHFRAKGAEVLRLVRDSRSYAEPTIAWNPAAGTIDAAKLEGLDAVICLSGKNIATRWTESVKQELFTSRVDSVTLLANTIANLNAKPRIYICASGVGYFGNRGDEILSDDSPKGDSILCDLCEQWEAAAQPAAAAGVRTVNLRFGLVLDRSGGFLKQILPIFKLGLGGPIGPGNQWTTWISSDDVRGIVDFAIEHTELRGPLNTVSPQPLTNRDMTKVIAAALHRPAIFKVPAFAVRLALGEAADELVLASTRAVPTRLNALGYTFKHTTMDAALQDLLPRG